MKVELSKLRLAMTALTESVVIGLPAKDNQSFSHQQDVTNDFIKAVIEKFGPNHKTRVRGQEGNYDITVMRVKD